MYPRVHSSLNYSSTHRSTNWIPPSLTRQYIDQLTQFHFQLFVHLSIHPLKPPLTIHPVFPSATSFFLAAWRQPPHHLQKPRSVQVLQQINSEGLLLRLPGRTLLPWGLDRAHAFGSRVLGSPFRWGPRPCRFVEVFGLEVTEFFLQGETYFDFWVSFLLSSRFILLSFIVSV